MSLLHPSWTPAHHISAVARRAEQLISCSIEKAETFSAAVLWSGALIRSCPWKITIIIMFATNLSITCALTVLDVLIHETEKIKAQQHVQPKQTVEAGASLQTWVFFIQAVVFVRLLHRRSLLSGLQYLELLFRIKMRLWWFKMSSYLESTLLFCRKKPVQLLVKALKRCLACWFNSCSVGSSSCNYCQKQMCIFLFKNRYLSATQATHTSRWLHHAGFLNPFPLHIQRQRSRTLTYCLQSAAFVENRAHVHTRLFPIFVVSVSLCLHTGADRHTQACNLMHIQTVR